MASTRNVGKISKNDDKNSLAVRKIQSSSVVENKHCFECDQRGPTYADMTIGSFVCTKCSGMLRGITPSHRLKSISMSTFSSDDVEFLRLRGNAWCARVWLGLCDDKRPSYILGRFEEASNDNEDSIKRFIAEKYEKKRYYVNPDSLSAPPVPAFIQPSSTSSALSGYIGTAILRRNGHLVSHSISNNISSSYSSSIPSASISVQHKSSTSLNADFIQNGLSGVSEPFRPRIKGGAISGGGVSQIAPESFANFDEAFFDVPSPPDSTVGSSVRRLTKDGTLPRTESLNNANHRPWCSGSSFVTNNEASTHDRYAALKDLDEIFKTATVINDTPDMVMSFENRTNDLFPSDKVVWPFQNQHYSENLRNSLDFSSTVPPSSKINVNPFTGICTSDLTATKQLNTSPWPIASTSSNSPVSTEIAPRCSSPSTFSSGSSSVSRNPFGASSNKSGSSCDLFLNAPKPPPPPPPAFVTHSDGFETPVSNGVDFFENMKNAWTSSFPDSDNLVSSNPWFENAENSTPLSASDMHNVSSPLRNGAKRSNNPFL